MEIVGILQARMSSSRLPGKVLAPVLGKPMLLRQIERLRRSLRLKTIVVATSTDSSDDPLESMCIENGVECYRGNLTDVLDRFYHAAVKYKANHIARLTGDCPLADPEVLDLVIDEYEKNKVDYASNALEPSYPDGLDVEVFTFEALARAWLEAKLTSEREHVTPFILKHPELFKLHMVKNKDDLSFMRWTVDNPEDFKFVTEVYASLYPTDIAFSSKDILDLLHRQPDLLKLNTHLERNEGYRKSINNDRVQGV